MRARLRTAVVKIFDLAMRAEMPDFLPYDEEPIPPGCRLYRRDLKGRALFVMLITHRKEEAFTLELGVGENGRWSPDPATGIRGARRVRLARLWSKGQTDPWWEFAPKETLAEITSRMARGEFSRPLPLLDESLGRVQDLVGAAMERLKGDGMPYFMDNIPSRNIERPSVA